MKNYFKLMRVRHYIKNLLIFAALICGGGLFNYSKFIAGIWGFLSFCFLSSAVYIFNDIKDKESDRNHPIKCNRPIANGSISTEKRVFLIFILLFISLYFNSRVFYPFSTFLLLLYFMLNFAYSLGMKNFPIIDVLILTSGFLIRIIYGAYITNITVSNWLYLTIFYFALFFSFGKRRNELKNNTNLSIRKVLKKYPADFLDKNMYMCLVLANISYTLWSIDEKTIQVYNNTRLIFTVPLVFTITMKYSLDIENNFTGDPVEILTNDIILLFLCGIYLIIMLAFLYL